MSASDRTLITGFGPFRNVPDNPSAKIATGLGRPHRILEVSFAAINSFISELSNSDFDCLLMLGARAHGHAMCFEAFAHNRIGSLPDVHGVVAPKRIIRRPAPMLLKSTMLNAKVENWLKDQPPCRIELGCDAGRYLCNYIYFEALSKFPDKKIGFVHVLSEQAIPIESQTETTLSLLEVVES